MYIPVAIMAVRAVLLPPAPSPIQKEKPVHSREMAKNGNVTSKRKRLPKVSMVKKAGNAKTQFRMPVPIEKRRALVSENPPWTNISVL